MRALRARWLPVLGAVGCSTVLGLDDVTYEDPPASGATSAAVTTSTTGTLTGSTSSAGGATTASTSSAGGADTGGGGAGAGDPGAGGTGGGDQGGGGTCGGVDPRSDEFEGAGGMLDPKWTPLEGAPGLLAHFVEDSRLTIEAGESQWYEDGPGGPFFYQEVEGDFLVWSRVRATDGVGDPTEIYHGTGLLLREPRQPPGVVETFVMISVGNINGACGIGITLDVDGDSPDTPLPTLPQSDSCTGDIAICRLGGVTRVFGRETPSDAWSTTDISRGSPDGVFPPTLQVGPAAYRYLGTENLVGEFDFVTFVPLCAATCEDLLPEGT